MTDARKPSIWPEFKLRLIQLLMVISGICVLTPLLLPMFIHTSCHSRRGVCQNNLSQMYKGMHVYMTRFGSNTHYPPHTGDAFWTCLLGHAGPEHPAYYRHRAPLVDSPDLFCCPETGTKPSSVVPGGGMKDYLGPQRHARAPSSNPSALVDGIDPGAAIACDAPGNHKQEGKDIGGNVLRFDGSVHFTLQDEGYLDAVDQCTD